MGKTVCRACNAPIIFLKTPKGKWMPCEPKPIYFEPDESGSLVLITARGGEYVRCREAKAGGVYDPQRVGHVPHWKTCPAAQEFRENGRVPQTPAPPAPKKRPEEEADYGGYAQGMEMYKDWPPDALLKKDEELRRAVRELDDGTSIGVRLYASGRRKAITELILEKEDL